MQTGSGLLPCTCHNALQVRDPEWVTELTYDVHGAHIQSSRPEHVPLAHASELTPLNRRRTFREELRMTIARTAVDTATVPNSATAPHSPIKTHLGPKLRSVVPCRRDCRCRCGRCHATPPLPLQPCSKNDVSRKKSGVVCHRSYPGNPASFFGAS